jgi:hypothetical protein
MFRYHEEDKTDQTIRGRKKSTEELLEELKPFPPTLEEYGIWNILFLAFVLVRVVMFALLLFVWRYIY